MIGQYSFIMPAIMTACGPIDCERDSWTLCLAHEHLLHSISKVVHRKIKSEHPLIMEELYDARNDPLFYRNGVNFCLDNEYELFRELCNLHTTSDKKKSKILILNTTSDAETSTSHSFFHKSIKNLANRLAAHDIHIVNAYNAFDQAHFDSELTEQHAQTLITELTYGTTPNDTKETIFYGALYHSIHFDSECKGTHLNLISSLAKLHANGLRVPLFLSFTHESDQTHDAIQYYNSFFEHLKRSGADMTRMIFCHAGREADNHSCAYNSFIFNLAKQNVCLLFSNIGFWNACEGRHIHSHAMQKKLIPARDENIAHLLCELIENGYARNILLSPSIMLKTQLIMYGGYGYNYLERYFKPILKAAYTDKDASFEKVWKQMTCWNLLHLLQWHVFPSRAPAPIEVAVCSICKKEFQRIIGEFFTKFSFLYCSVKCLRRHSRLKFAALEGM